jgi:two-component system, NtrC family, response regulator AtoC
MKAKSILVVDDEPQVGMMLSLHLRGLGLNVVTVESGRQAWRALSENTFDCILTDLVMPDGDGFWLLEQIATLARPPIALIMSGHADAEVAIRALDQGAYDYVPKPFRPEEVIFRIRRALERVEMSQELERLRLERKQVDIAASGIITRSKIMHDLLGIVKRVAPFKTTVLITGESGTGKELVARALHDNGDRAHRAFVAVNCGAIPEHLLESELFGHKKGAFTDAVTSRKGLFEEADGGTLFLDEVGELPLQVQVKLLRVLQEGKIRRVGESVPVNVDVRIVAATVRDLKAAVQDKRFREDLFYRLNVMPIELPPLRDRTEDIPLLIEHFLSIHREDQRTTLSSVRRDAMADLLEYAWPGNVRELQNLVERIVILAEGDELTRQALPAHFHSESPSQNAIVRGAGLVSSPHKSLKQALQGVEKDLIASALQETDGNRTRAARLLEISHRSLLYKIKSYGIE